MTLASPFVAAGGKGESKSSRQLETDRFAVDFHLAAPGKSPSLPGTPPAGGAAAPARCGRLASPSCSGPWRRGRAGAGRRGDRQPGRPGSRGKQELGEGSPGGPGPAGASQPPAPRPAASRPRAWVAATAAAAEGGAAGPGPVRGTKVGSAAALAAGSRRRSLRGGEPGPPPLWRGEAGAGVAAAGVARGGLPAVPLGRRGVRLPRGALPCGRRWVRPAGTTSSLRVRRRDRPHAGAAPPGSRSVPTASNRQLYAGGVARPAAAPRGTGRRGVAWCAGRGSAARPRGSPPAARGAGAAAEPPVAGRCGGAARRVEGCSSVGAGEATPNSWVRGFSTSVVFVCSALAPLCALAPGVLALLGRNESGSAG